VAIDVPVPGRDQGYAVLVGEGLLARAGAHLRRTHEGAKVAIVSDTNVMPLHGDTLERSLTSEGFEVARFTVTAGEHSKSPAQLVELVRELVRAGFGRRDVVATLGGGVVGDLGGLVAATFMRGIGLLHCPTSLLAQVDASVGGKVAVDLPEGKNLLGAFHFPLAVLIDPATLVTLPDRELRAGAAEMLKHGALFSPEHFAEVAAAWPALARRDGPTLARLIATSVALKAACVGRDPHEQSSAGRGRILLNLGHTVGHAIEAASAYELLHGEAVGLGLLAAARVSERRGVAERANAQEGGGLEATIRAALEQVGLPTELDGWLHGPRAAALAQALEYDKKRASGTLAFIALTALGSPRVVSLTPGEILQSLREEPRDC
jgi:3-dehydroquinate synthase